MAAPTLTINANGELEIVDGTSGDPVTWNDVWDWDDGGGSSGGDGDVPIDGGGTAKVSAYMTEHVADGVYQILDDIAFGDGASASYFQSANEMVYFDDGVVFVITANATLSLGILSNGYGIQGSYWNFAPASNQEVIKSGVTTATFLLYDSTLQSRNADIWFQNGTVTINKGELRYDIPATEKTVWFGGMLSISELYTVCQVFYTLITPVLLEGVHSHNTEFGAQVFGNVTFTDLLATNPSVAELRQLQAATMIVKDPRFSVATTDITNASGIIIEQYTCNIHVTDKDGANLQSVDVDCEYANLVEGTDSKTYKCIQDNTSVDATHKPITGSDWQSFWELFDAGGGLGGVWQTTFDFKAGTQEFAQQTTDANGDISEQVIQYKKWVGTSELLEVRIHKFTYTHASYPDSTMEDKIISMPIVWEVDMGQSTSDLEVIVNSQVLDVMNVDTYPEPGQGAPAATASIFTKMNYMYKSWRNRKTSDGSTSKLWNDAKDTVDQKATLTNAGGTVTVDEMESGP